MNPSSSTPFASPTLAAGAVPVVAIVGRPNVGKSSLLNALAHKRISIVQDMPGVTRDRVSYHIPIDIRPDGVPDVRYVELVDTGGYGFVDPDKLTEHISHQIEMAMARANLVLYVVDCADGMTTADQGIASMLRQKGIRTVLVANKADGPKADTILGEFARLGFGTPIGVSAMNNRNIDQVEEAIRQNLDLSQAPTELPKPEMLVAIVGKRNAGKSSLVNSIAQIYEGEGDRVIVSEVPGTTRDSIDVRFEKDGKTLVVIDTAGVRKKRHMLTNDIEFYSYHRAQVSIRRADVVLMLIDATEPVSEPDKKLAMYIVEQHKPVVIVVNKWDLAREKILEQRPDVGGKPVRDEDVMEEYRVYLDGQLPHIDYAPLAFTTAKDGKNVHAVIDLAQHLFNQANLRLGTSRLNTVVRDILAERGPSTPSGRRARVYYATQTNVAPPTIVLFVNNPDFITEPYQRFMINRFRELLPYPEVPIKLVIRGRPERGAGPSLDEIKEQDGGAVNKPRPTRARKHTKRRAEPKPRPKRASASGPRRGQRPK